MKVIQKSLTNASGHENACWIAVNGSFSLINNSGSVQLVGWKDVESFSAGLKPDDNKMVDFILTDISTFGAVWTEIATKLISEGTFAGGSLVDANFPQPPPLSGN